MSRQNWKDKSFSYSRDINEVRRQGSTAPAVGKPMKEALEAKRSNEMMSHAITTYCRHIQQFDAHEGINGLPEGTIFHEMRDKGLLSITQFKAAEYIYTDAIQAWGKSGKQTSSYSEAVDVSGGPKDFSRAKTTMHHDRFIRLVEHLHKYQWGFLVMIIEEIRMGKDRKIDLAMLGRRLTPYANDTEAEAAAVGHMQSFLTSSAEFYGHEMKQRGKTTVRVTQRTQFAKVALET